MDITLSSKEIDLLHFLSDRPWSSDQDILVAVTEIAAKVQLGALLKRTANLGLIQNKNGVLFSLTSLGEVLIGKGASTDFLAQEILRRKLPTPPVVRTTNYDWGKTAQAASPDSSRLNATKAPKGKVSPSKKEMSHPALTETIVVTESAKAPSQPAKDKAMSNNTGKQSEQEVQPVYFFDKDARDLLSILQHGPVEITSDNLTAVDGLIVRGLAKRGEQGAQADVCTLTAHGELALGSDGFLGFTQYFDLSKAERLTVELLALGYPFLIRSSDLNERLSLNGITLTRDERVELLESLKAKGLVVQRGNKMWYFSAASVGLVGMNRQKMNARQMAEFDNIKVLPKELVAKVAAGEVDELIPLNGRVELPKQKAKKATEVKEPVESPTVTDDAPDQVELSLPSGGDEVEESIVANDTSGADSDSVTAEEIKDEDGNGDKTMSVEKTILQEIQEKSAKLQAPEVAPVENLEEKLGFLKEISAHFFPEDGSASAKMIEQIMDDLQR